MTCNKLSFKKGETVYDIASKIKTEIDEILNTDFENVDGEIDEDRLVDIDMYNSKK